MLLQHPHSETYVCNKARLGLTVLEIARTNIWICSRYSTALPADKKPSLDSQDPTIFLGLASFDCQLSSYRGYQQAVIREACHRHPHQMVPTEIRILPCVAHMYRVANHTDAVVRLLSAFGWMRKVSEDNDGGQLTNTGQASVQKVEVCGTRRLRTTPNRIVRQF